jgi:GDP-L-fucose synthase
LGFWRGRRVLVTGGTGFVGSRVTALLLQEGATVAVTSRSASVQTAPDVELCVGDLEDPGFAARSCRNREIVLHLAAHVGGVAYNRVRHATLFLRNMRPFQSVLEAAHAAGIQRFLVTSSACVYPREGPFPLVEGDGTKGEPEATNAGYGWAKRMQEYLGAAFAREHGLAVAIARPFNAYGPGDDFRAERSHVIAALVRRACEGEDPFVVWGSGNQTRSFLYVDDFARGLLLLAEKHPVAEPVNLGSREEVSIRTLVDMVLRAAGHTPRVVFDPARPEGQPRRSCDVTRMVEVLGWEPTTPLAEGLRRTVEWYRAS